MMGSMDDWFIHGAVIFGVLVVAPMAMSLSNRLQGRSRIPRWVPVAAGAMAATSFLVSPGVAAAGLCIPWLAVCVVAGLEKVGNPRTLVARLPYLLPHAYLAFGAGWLILSRYGARPLDFPSVIVELTAVHFHYAGFVAPVVIAATRSGQARARPGLLVALWLALAASPLTAIGFVYSATIGAVGAVMFTCGLVVWSVITLVVVVPNLPGGARSLLAVAAGSVLVSMSLASLYAIGVAAGEAWIDVPTMARTHGILNAVGFAFCGTAAWLAIDKPVPRGPQRAGVFLS